MFPVHIVQLDLDEVPVIPVMPVHQPFPGAPVAVERETEIPYPSCIALLETVVDGAILHMALHERLKAPHADGVQEVIVYELGP